MNFVSQMQIFPQTKHESTNYSHVKKLLALIFKKIPDGICSRKTLMQ
jgi:hypothetical protein